MSKIEPTQNQQAIAMPPPPPYYPTGQQYGYENQPAPPPPPPGFSQNVMPAQPPAQNLPYPSYPPNSTTQTYSTVNYPAQGNQLEINVVVSAPETAQYSNVPADVKHAETYMCFSERSIKMAFIRKVYSILTLQLLVTFGFISLFIFVEPIRSFCRNNPWMLAVSFSTMLFCMILMCCVVAVRRKYPYNLILLGVFTLCESFAVATFTTYFDVSEVLMAFGITIIITVGITVFTLQSKWDFTFCAVSCFLLILFAISFGSICGLYYGCGWNYYCYYSYGHYYCAYRSSWYIIGCGLGALLFALYLMIDTAWMIGGKHKFGLSPEEYIFAALNLYLDIIMIFMYILMLLGGSRN